MQDRPGLAVGAPMPELLVGAKLPSDTLVTPAAESTDLVGCA